jgi:hypothetical protein
MSFFSCFSRTSTSVENQRMPCRPSLITFDDDWEILTKMTYPIPISCNVFSTLFHNGSPGLALMLENSSSQTNNKYMVGLRYNIYNLKTNHHLAFAMLIMNFVCLLFWHIDTVVIIEIRKNTLALSPSLSLGKKAYIDLNVY